MLLVLTLDNTIIKLATMLPLYLYWSVCYNKPQVLTLHGMGKIYAQSYSNFTDIRSIKVLNMCLITPIYLNDNKMNCCYSGIIVTVEPGTGSSAHNGGTSAECNHEHSN